MVGMSHSPFATMLPPTGAGAPGGRFLAAAARVAAAAAALAPDTLVVIGPDHFHANFYDVMPPFVLGVEEAEAFGDFGSRSGPLPVAAELAWAIRDGVAGDGFDIALSYALTVDHGIVQSYEMVRGGADLPLVPLVVNTAAPPLPSMSRCVALGKSLGAAIRGADAGRVLIVASGGLSHWLPSNDPRDALVPAEVEPVTGLGDEGLQERAGSGGHEIRTWLVGFAAAGRPLVWTSYEPVPEWVTGMGIGTTFE